ncbi:MAG: methyltransferase domain-containing protein [Candidatus Saganbacteria bacterium]|nr:methyltransferase domain-containing protein [Candidatus Saganbacteria bacterium]
MITGYPSSNLVNRIYQSESGKYGRNYYEKGTAIKNGKTIRVSCYRNYHWDPDYIRPTIKAIVQEFGLKTDRTILDYGCAKGFYVRFFRLAGYQAFGADISSYARRSAFKDTKEYLCLIRTGKDLTERFHPKFFDFTMAKETLEHIPEELLFGTLDELSIISKVGFITLPITKIDGGRYINNRPNVDKTHVIKLTRNSWINLLAKYGEVTELPALAAKLEKEDAKGALYAKINFK